METNGSLSVMKRPEVQSIIKSDLDIKAEKVKNIPREVISDGKIMKANLKELNKDEEWLKNELIKNNIKSAKDVFYAEVRSDGTFYISQ